VSSSPTERAPERLLEIVMPQLGITVTEGTLVHWRKKPGDAVAPDEAICDVSSDKIDTEIPSPAAGEIAELLIEVGTTVEVGTVIATMSVAEDALRAPSPAGALVPVGEGEPGGPAPVVAADGGAGRHSPVVVRLAEELGVALEGVVGTGRDGRVRREDVIAASSGSVSAANAAETRYVPPPVGRLSRMRQSIGEHTKRSLNTAATVTSWIEVDFSAIEERRRALGITALPIVAAATIATLGEFGELNAWLDGHDHTLHSEVNLGIAVSLGTDGLIVPVVRSAQALDVEALAQRIGELAGRARGGELTPDEVRDGTFTITNPGQFGTFMATPVIYQPQVAILDIESIVRRPVVVIEDGVETIAIRPVCVLGLSWDHRALDGVYAAHFLSALRERLQGAG
jgi:pyruvate/2-oxoglutarate dehydrogenase complex dihydrolipoamide acyltransferase (E2) component